MRLAEPLHLDVVQSVSLRREYGLLLLPDRHRDEGECKFFLIRHQREQWKRGRGWDVIQGHVLSVSPGLRLHPGLSLLLPMEPARGHRVLRPHMPSELRLWGWRHLLQAGTSIDVCYPLSQSCPATSSTGGTTGGTTGAATTSTGGTSSGTANCGDLSLGLRGLLRPGLQPLQQLQRRSLGLID